MLRASLSKNWMNFESAKPEMVRRAPPTEAGERLVEKVQQQGKEIDWLQMKAQLAACDLCPFAF